MDGKAIAEAAEILEDEAQSQGMILEDDVEDYLEKRADHEDDSEN